MKTRREEEAEQPIAKRPRIEADNPTFNEDWPSGDYLHLPLPALPSSPPSPSLPSLPSLPSSPLPPEDIRPDYSQDRLIAKLEAYLRLKGESLVTVLPPVRENHFGKTISLARKDPFRGHCHGLTLTWLRKKNDSRVEWFYRTKEKIIDSPLDEFCNFEIDVEKFLGLIHWAQHPNEFIQGVFQEHIHTILDAKEVTSEEKKFSFSDLCTFLRRHRKEGNMICLSSSGLGLKNHSVGVFVEHEGFSFFNANERSGREIFYLEEASLVNAIKFALYMDFNLSIPSQMLLFVGVANAPAYVPAKKTSTVKLFSQKRLAVTTTETEIKPIVLPQRRKGQQ